MKQKFVMGLLFAAAIFSLIEAIYDMVVNGVTLFAQPSFQTAILFVILGVLFQQHYFNQKPTKPKST